MLYIHDKAKTIFDVTINGKSRLKKAKIISIALEESSEKANNYFIDSSDKRPAHFILDDANIVKYNYNTTNVFLSDTKWTSKSKNIIEPVQLDTPEEISNTVSITDKPLSHKTFTEAQIPLEIVLYYSENTAEDFYIYLDRREDETAYHYLIDDKQCYCVCPAGIKCYTENQIHVVVLGKNNLFDTLDRAAKLITQLLNTYNLSQYMPIEDENHIHAMPDEHMKSIKNRIRVLNETGGTNDIGPTSIRKDNLNPGDHIIHVKLLYSSPRSFVDYEKNLIKFLAEYLFYFDLDISSIWRIGDLATSGDGALFYNRYSDYEKFLACIEEGLQKLKNGVQQIEVSTSGLPEFDDEGNLITHPFEKDKRDIRYTTYFLTNSQKSVNQDYDSYTIGSNVELRSKFEDGAGAFSETLKVSSNYYEPIYPDLTVPPRNSTTLYNKGLMSPHDIIKEMEQPKKPVLGKTPNAFDPYPTDAKIAQLEMHAPTVTLEYESASEIQGNLFGFMNNRFGNTEKRLVRIENILSTIMRYQARLASRININCVYYGGQSVFGRKIILNMILPS